MFKRNLTSDWLLLTAVALLLLPGALFAQDDDTGEFVSINNGYIGVDVYRSGDSTSGRFQIWNMEGDPSTTADDHQPVIRTGGVQFMCDIYTGESSDLTLEWAAFAKGGHVGLFGDIEDDGYWALQPHVTPDRQSIRSIWMPTPEQDDYPLRVQCEQEVRLFHDMVRFKWTITNNDIYAHQIGLKVHGDIVTDAANGGVVDHDNAISLPGFPLIEKRTLFPGAGFADTRYCPSFEVFNSARNPRRGVKVLFDGLNATPPDVIGIDEYSVLASTGWSYINDPLNGSYVPRAVWGYNISPVGDTIKYNIGYGAAWKPVRIQPGGKRTIIHYIANPASAHSVAMPNAENPRFAAAISGPKALKYAVDDAGLGSFAPSTFEISAFLENQDTYTDLTNCSFTLILPAGLRLDSSENAYTKTIPQILPSSDQSVSWLVKPDGTRTGVLTYHVAINAYPMGGTVLKRDIHIPAMSSQTFSYGWQQVAVPFSLSNANPATALGLPPGSIIRMFRYDPNLPATAPYWPYEDVQLMVPGEAYWLKMSRLAATDMVPGNFTALQWDGVFTRSIPLAKGWNMIGNPYVYCVTAGETTFYHESLGNLSYDEAIAKGLISKTLWWWNTTYNTWNWSTQRTAQIKPWQGYWVKVLDSRVIGMKITPASQIGAGIGGVGTGGAGDDDDPPPSF